MRSIGGAYRVSWDSSQLKDEDFVIEAIKFEGYESSRRLLPFLSFDLPEEVYFESNKAIVDTIDFPINDMGWFIIRKKYYDVIFSCGKFSHEVINIYLIDDSVLGVNRYLPSGDFENSVVDHDFIAIRILEVIDIFDYKESDYMADPLYPKSTPEVDKWVLNIPPEGVPAVFYVDGFFSEIFVSSDVGNKLLKEKIRGMRFHDDVLM